MANREEPTVPYAYAATNSAPPLQTQQQQFYYAGQNPYQDGMIPPNAIYGDPKGIPLQQTMYQDTPAPFNCVFCGNSGITNIKIRLNGAIYQFSAGVKILDQPILNLQ